MPQTSGEQTAPWWVVPRGDRAFLANRHTFFPPYPRTNGVSVPNISSRVRRNWSIWGLHRDCCNRSLCYPHWLLVPTKNLAGAEQCQTDHENAALQPTRPNENGTHTIEPFDLPAASESVPRNDTNASQRQRSSLTKWPAHDLLNGGDSLAALLLR